MAPGFTVLAGPSSPSGGPSPWLPVTPSPQLGPSASTKGEHTSTPAHRPAPLNLSCQTGPHACLCVHPDLGLKQDSVLLSRPLRVGLLGPHFSPTPALPAHHQGVPQTEGSDLSPVLGAGAAGISRQWDFKAIRLKYLCELVKV